LLKALASPRDAPELVLRRRDVLGVAQMAGLFWNHGLAVLNFVAFAGVALLVVHDHVEHAAS